jgi:hypothetical protein
MNREKLTRIRNVRKSVIRVRLYVINISLGALNSHKENPSMHQENVKAKVLQAMLFIVAWQS